MRITFSTLALTVTETFTMRSGHPLKIRAVLDRSTFPEAWIQVCRYMRGTNPLDFVCTAMGSSLVIQKPEPLKLLIIDCHSVEKRIEVVTCDSEPVVFNLTYLTQSDHDIDKLAESRSQCWTRLIQSVGYGSVLMNYHKPYVSLVPTKELVWEHVSMIKE